MITISAIKADIGGYVGHSSMHPDILALGQEELEKARQRGLLVDSHATHCGDGVFLIITHERPEDKEEVHSPAGITSHKRAESRGTATGRVQVALAFIGALFGLAAVILGAVWQRHRDKLHQDLRELHEMEHRLDDRHPQDVEHLWWLVLALVAGLFALAAAIIGPVLNAVMSS